MTREAAARLLDAHIALAKAEAGPIIENVKGVAVAAGVAIGFAFFAALVVTVGTPLFLGEWIFGSLGWGILHGIALTAAVIAIAAWLILVAEPAGVFMSVAIGTVIGLTVGIVLAFDLTHRAWAAAAEALAIASAPDGARLVVATIATGVLVATAAAFFLGVIGAVVGALVGRISGRGSAGFGAGIGLVFGLVAGLLGGLVFGALNAEEIANRFGIVVDDDWWLLIVAGAVGAVVGAVLGTLIGAWNSGRSARDGLVGGTFLGLTLGAFTAVAFGPQVGAAFGVLFGLLAIAAAAGTAVARHGVDEEALRARFYPTQTIEMTKETVEWLQQRSPMGPQE